MKQSIGEPGYIPLSERVTEQVIQYIQANRMQRGDRLPNEKKLMERLNVSRGTIREAMRSLSSRGIVVIRQGSGTYISDLLGVAEDPLGLAFKYDKQKMVMDLLELRFIMEPSIAAQSARRISPGDVEELRTLAAKVTSCIRGGESHEDADVAFHCKIAASTGNDILNVLFPEIAKGIRLFTTLLEDRIIHDVTADHERIAEAIASGDTQRAYNAMMAHLERNRYAIEEFLEQTGQSREKQRNDINLMEETDESGLLSGR